jgi:hypothetical protein
MTDEQFLTLLAGIYLAPHLGKPGLLLGIAFLIIAFIGVHGV